jgi:uncharacterized protein YggE
MPPNDTEPGPRVATVGRGTARAAPDAALLSLEVWAELDTPEAALDEVARRTEVLQGVLDRAGVDAAARSTAGVSLSERWDYRHDEHVFVGYRASTVVSARIEDLAVLGAVISESTREAQARPHGPSWQIDPDNPARVEACRVAAEDARRKAEAYARALGLRLGAVLSIREPGARPRPFQRQPVMRAMAAGGGGPDMPVESGDVDVAAAVTVVFELIGAEPG